MTIALAKSPRPLAASIVVPITLLAIVSGACSGSRGTAAAPRTKLADITLSDDRVLTDVEMSSASDEVGDVIVFYRTPVSLTVCERANQEVREAWGKQLREQARSRGARRVVIFPEDPTGSSQSFVFVAANDQGWSEEFVPCRRTEAVPPSMTSIGVDKQRRPLL